MEEKIRQLKAGGAKSVLCDLAGLSPAGGEAKHLAHALREGDAAAQQILQETAEDLAFGLSHAAHLFHPEVIVIGGGLSQLGESLRAAVAGALPRFVMRVFHGGPQVRLAALGEDAVPVGCLAVARSGAEHAR